MSLKKGFFALVFMTAITFSGYALPRLYAGYMASYNPFNPAFWDLGIMINGGFVGENYGHYVRAGMGFGSTTLTYERKNPYHSQNKLTEYWQKSFFMETILGYHFQFGFVDAFNFRLGVDVFFSTAPAFAPQDVNSIASRSSLDEFSAGFTGVAGIVLFPKRKYSVIIEACPGYQNDSHYNAYYYAGATDHQTVFAFIMPIRLTVSAGL